MTGRLRVNEIFYSLQGESTFAGRPCVFVRLTGCNLRCVWCDTAYAFYEGRQMSIDDVIERVRGFGCGLVEITGGEPTLQKGFYPLTEALLGEGFVVMVETSGESDLSRLDPRIIKVMDLKCPASGECSRNRWSNIELLTSRDEAKFVIADRADYEWAREVIERYQLALRVNAILLSPVFGRIDAAALAAWILEDHLPARLQLQLHKQLWGPFTRGV